MEANSGRPGPGSDEGRLVVITRPQFLVLFNAAQRHPDITIRAMTWRGGLLWDMQFFCMASIGPAVKMAIIIDEMHTDEEIVKIQAHNAQIEQINSATFKDYEARLNELSVLLIDSEVDALSKLASGLPPGSTDISGITVDHADILAIFKKGSHASQD